MVPSNRICETRGRNNQWQRAVIHHRFQADEWCFNPAEPLTAVIDYTLMTRLEKGRVEVTHQCFIFCGISMFGIGACINQFLPFKAFRQTFNGSKFKKLASTI